MISSRQGRHLDKLHNMDCSIKYLTGADNLVADVLSRIHHLVSATPAANISINTMELRIIGAEEWTQEVGEFVVEDVYFCAIFNVLCRPAETPDAAANRATQCSKLKHYPKARVRTRLL